MKRILCTPDLHFPFMDRKAVASLLQYVSEQEWDEWIDLGDRIDFDFISKHVEGYPRLTMGKQFTETYQGAGAELARWLVAVRTKNPKCKATWIEGNHEYRVQRYLDKHPELEGSIEVPTQMELNRRGVTWIPYWSTGRTYRVGKCTFLHGTWVNEHHAKKHVMAFMTSVVYGHAHNLQSYSLVKQSQQHPIEGTSLGCLCAPQPYMRGKPNNWQTAFGVFYFEPNGHFQKYVVRIINGKFRSPEGEWYE